MLAVHSTPPHVDEPVCPCGQPWSRIYRDLELDALLALGLILGGKVCPNDWDDEIPACPDCGNWR